MGMYICAQLPVESKRAPSLGAGVIGGSDLPSKSAVVLWKSRQVLLTTEPSSFSLLFCFKDKNLCILGWPRT